jgi:hypothetical protein
MVRRRDVVAQIGGVSGELPAAITPIGVSAIAPTKNLRRLGLLFIGSPVSN